MTYTHCDPCDAFDLCPSCEQETCQVCGENYTSDHMHLNDEASDKLMSLIEDEMLMPNRFCNECLFYAHRDPNDAAQADYDDNLVYKIEEERVEKRDMFRGNSIEIKKRIVIVGPKPKRTFATRRGAFYLMPPK